MGMLQHPRAAPDVLLRFLIASTPKNPGNIGVSGQVRQRNNPRARGRDLCHPSTAVPRSCRPEPRWEKILSPPCQGQWENA